jgi:hypothetical protein
MNADHTVERMDDIVEWERRYGLDERVIARDVIGKVLITTQFLGLEIGENRQGKPLLFESLVMKGPLDGTKQHYANYADAMVGHGALLLRVQSAEAD